MAMVVKYNSKIEETKISERKKKKKNYRLSHLYNILKNYMTTDMICMMKWQSTASLYYEIYYRAILAGRAVAWIQ